MSCSKLVRFCQSARLLSLISTKSIQHTCIRALWATRISQGKNIYYGYTQKKNQQRSGKFHSAYMYGFGLLILFIGLKGPALASWLELEFKAAELEQHGGDKVGEDGERKQVVQKRKKTTFREKRIIEYENRIRNYSTPDKIFRYFATLKVHKHDKAHPQNDHDEIYMTPEDFVRSLMPGIMQPEDLGLDRFKRFDPSSDSLELVGNCSIKLREDSIFYRLEKHGLISFSDYILLLTLLSTPSRQFVLAFKMFDDNGDGNLDINEYERVQAIIRSRTNVGQRHRDHANTGSVLRSDPNGALSKYFFGDELKGKLPYQKFIQFHKELHDEVLWIEFHEFCDEAGFMSERDFANQILLYAGFSDAKRNAICKRVRREFKSEERAKGITYREYYDFAQVIKSINEVDTALTFYHVAGASIDKDTFRHVSKTVAKVHLTDHLVDVVFAIFDENGDERLSNKEFVSVMKRRVMRGLEKPRETGFAKLFSAITKCSQSMISDGLNSLKESV